MHIGRNYNGHYDTSTRLRCIAGLLGVIVYCQQNATPILQSQQCQYYLGHFKNFGFRTVALTTKVGQLQQPIVFTLLRL